MTDISCMGCMFQDIQTESRGFLSIVFCLTNVKLLPPALYNLYIYRDYNKHIQHKLNTPKMLNRTIKGA